MFKRGLNFFKPIIPEKDVKAFLADPVQYKAAGGAWYDEALAIAKTICGVSKVICPIIERTGG